MSEAAALCATCGSPVDPLRAKRVTIGDRGFEYHCCAQRGARPAARAPAEDDLALPTPRETAPVRLRPVAEPMPAELAEEEVPLEGTPPPLLLGTTIAATVVSLCLLFPAQQPVVTAARAIALLVAASTLAAEALVGRRRHASTWLSVGCAVTASLLAVGLRLRGSPRAEDATTLASFLVLSQSVLTLLVGFMARRTDARREALFNALSAPARSVSRDDVVVVAPHELRPGELVEVRAGERCPADLEIVSGRGRAEPYPAADLLVPVASPSFLLGGARLVEGTVTGRVAFAGSDRALARLLFGEGSRIDRTHPAGVWSAIASVHGALAAGGLAAIAAYLSRGHATAVDAALAITAAIAAFASPLAREVAGLHLSRAVLEAARLGVVYRDGEAFRAAARVTTAVLSARGTVMLGHPEVVEIEALSGSTEGEVLSLAASAFTFGDAATRDALTAAAKRRRAPRDRARGATHERGLGVRATTLDGDALLVGTRALLLDARVPIAMSEARVAELEATGRSVLLVAKGGRLVGLLALQDALADGARAAVYHLGRAAIEPALMSSDARETATAIARALGVDHVRPEVLPEDRVKELERMMDAGAVVAVIGRPDDDADLLAAAHVGVAVPMPDHGDLPAICVASGRVEAAALALSFPRAEEALLRLGAFLAFGPQVVALLGMLFGLAPIVLLPLATLLGGLGAAVHAKSTEPPDRRTSPWDLAVAPRRAPALSDDEG